MLSVRVFVQEKEIVKIQAFLKANKARDDYRTLSKSRYSMFLLFDLVVIPVEH